MPAKAGIQFLAKVLGLRFRGDERHSLSLSPQSARELAPDLVGGGEGKQARWRRVNLSLGMPNP